MTSKLNIEIRKKFVRCYVWRIALYESESWTLRQMEQEYLESFEMWCLRRMEKLKWSEKVTNEEILERMGKKRTRLNNMLRRIGNWIGHILRRNCLLHEAEEAEDRNRRKRQLTMEHTEEIHIFRKMMDLLIRSILNNN